jgi:hypothetical protein
VVLGGYLGYAFTHHATHHWRVDNGWSIRRKRWHAQHHHAAQPGCYGVTSAFWDPVFGSAAPRARPGARLSPTCQTCPICAPLARSTRSTPSASGLDLAAGIPVEMQRLVRQTAR